MAIEWPPFETSRLRVSHQDDAGRAFAPTPKLSQNILSEAWVALDTNVLLVPYAVANQQSFRDIERLYRRLRGESRLLVPGQAAREFAKIRQYKLAELVSSVRNVRSQTQAPQPPRAPLWSEHPVFQSAKTAWDVVQEPLTNYQKALKELVDLIEEFPSGDPVSEVYDSIFTSDVVVDPDFNEERFLEEHNRRKQKQIPPGYKDSTGPDTGYGDLLIWATLLHATADSNRDLIFVTEEKKEDWWHQSAGQPLAPRYELVDEYRQASGGGRLYLVSLASLLKKFGSSDDVVADVRATTMIDQHNNAVLVSDDETLLIRGDRGFGVVRPIIQSSPEDGERIAYRSWFATDLVDFESGVIDLPAHVDGGSARDGADVVVTAGPYQIPWSGSGDGNGWFYYHEWDGLSPSRPSYELAVVGTEPVDFAYFTYGVFQRGEAAY